MVLPRIDLIMMIVPFVANDSTGLMPVEDQFLAIAVSTLAS
jgi:hypothetical protein